MEKGLMELSAELVKSQASTQPLTPEDLATGLQLVFQTLQELHSREQGQVQSQPQSDPTLTQMQRHPAQSIQQNHVICLECGRAHRLLSNRHLALHNMTPNEYKRKWGLSLTSPLSSKALTQRRSKTAKAQGIGNALANWRAEQRKKTEGDEP